MRAIGKAKREIRVLAYNLTSASINEALAAAHQRGVKNGHPRQATNLIAF